ncbi:hypothetical protein ACI3L1_06725 [Deinococcus sp. SM5_A1]|uniref:hypothetical protein n=1 Tax=Deinococcus sp. SM5_A1 TaxID=3379094 RepID=UPI0038586A13
MITFDDTALLAALARLEAACDELPQIAEQVRGESLGHAILGARLNIYSTTRGAYQRTQDYLRGLDAWAQGSRNKASVTVSNSTEYALAVETGRGFSLVGLQDLALENPNPAQPITFGRSGQQWYLPGPVITGAQAFAAYRLQELFGEKVRAALK